MNFHSTKTSREIDIQFDNIFKSYYMDIFKYCQAHLQCDYSIAMDCAQEAFTLLYDKMSNGEVINHARAWLYRTADNYIKREIVACAKRFKRTQSLHEFNLEDTVFIKENDLDILIEENTIDIDGCMNRVFERLTLEEKELYQQHYKLKIPITTLAKQYQITETALTSRIYRLKKKIEKLVPEIIETNQCCANKN